MKNKMKNKRVSSKIYMLPTCLRVKENGELEFSGELSLNIKGFYKNESSQPQNLYFTVDEEIKEGDWFLYIKKDGTAMFPSKFNASKDTLKDGNDRKIIASTDPKLIADGVAQPTQAFIEAYCKQGGIDRVLVEYENTGCKGTKFNVEDIDTFYREKRRCTTCGKSSTKIGRGERGNICPTKVLTLKVDPIHNTITTITDMMKIAMYDLEGNLLDILRGDTLTEISNPSFFICFAVSKSTTSTSSTPTQK
jgi:hypothetical protein